ncbi:MAG TPA: hypothetical protein GX520_11025 [Syntrophaceticus sp.]|nr:hypothetical protein [Syntrophaceticus sp.]
MIRASTTAGKGTPSRPAAILNASDPGSISWWKVVKATYSDGKDRVKISANQRKGRM